MRPGELDERITIEQPSTTTGDYNAVIEGYSTAGTRWAAWRPGTGGEREQGRNIEGSIDGVFHVRRDSVTEAITYSYRITRSNGEKYQVVGTPVYQRDRDLYMSVPARRVVNA